MTDYRMLQNGSDIRGIAMENETGAVNLTDKAACDIAAAFVKWMKDNKEYSKKSKVEITLTKDVEYIAVFEAE